MSIQFTCPFCQKMYHLDESMQGKKVLCRVCQEAIAIPAAASSTPPASRQAPPPPPDGRRPREDRIAPSPRPRASDAPARRDDYDTPRSRPAERSRERSRDDDSRRGSRSDRSRSDETEAAPPRNNQVLILAGAGAGLLVAIGVVVGGMVLVLKGSNSSPTTTTSSTFRAQAADAPAGDAGAPFDRNDAPPANRDRDAAAPNDREAAVPDGAVPSEIAKERVQQVKRATVFIRVKMTRGVAEGSGFFAVKPGIVITNAHVLGMKEAHTQPPRTFLVIVNSGQAGERRLSGTVLYVDRTNDLAVVRVDATTSSLPAPLPIDSATKLTETQKVYIFGFPLGSQLGKDITVSESSVSSLRRDRNGNIDKVQVNGGMQPGNSGGPVTDARGVVVGVSVSGILGTQINFAIPADHIRQAVDRAERNPNGMNPLGPVAMDDPPDNMRPPAQRGGPGRQGGAGFPADRDGPVGPERGSGLQGDLAALKGTWESGDITADGGGAAGTIKLQLSPNTGTGGGRGRMEIRTKQRGRTTSSTKTFTFSLHQQGDKRAIVGPLTRLSGLVLIYSFDGGQLVLSGAVTSLRHSYTLKNITMTRLSAEPGDVSGGAGGNPAAPGDGGAGAPGFPGGGGAKGSPNGIKISGDVYAFVQKALEERRFTEVDIKGFTLGKQDKDKYLDVGTEGGVLIGFQVAPGRFVNNVILKSWRPIFMTKNGEKLGTWHGVPVARPIVVKAKPGYVVSGMAIRTGLGVDGFTLTYARLGKEGLDMDDTYNSPQLGGEGGSLSMIGGKGALFVGITGYLSPDRSPCALGLVAVLPKE